MSLAHAKFTVEFPHGAGRLRVLEREEPRPRCKRAVKLLVVPLDAPESATCLGCFGPSAPFPEEPAP